MARDIPVQVVINGRNDSGPAFNSLGSSLTRIGETAAGFLGAQVFSRITDGILSMGSGALDTAKQLEQVRIGFKGTLGSFEAADKTITAVKDAAAKTPFELPGLLQMTQLLSSVTKDGDRSLQLVTSLGNAISFVGKGQPELDRIISNMQQIKAVGQASLMDLRQFGFAGIDIFGLLARQTGKTGEALQDFISSGGVTFETLEGLFNSASAAGGEFFGAMDEQSKSMVGIQSNISDTFNQIASSIITESGLFDLIKEGLSKVLDFFNNNKDRIIGFFKEIGDAIISSGLFEMIKQGIKDIAGFISENKEEIINFFKDVVALIPKILEVIAGAVVGMKNLLTAVVNALTLISGHVDSFIRFVSNIVSSVQSVAQQVVNAFNWMGATVSSIWNGLVGTVRGAFNYVIDLANSFFRRINSTIAQINSVGQSIGVNVNFRVGEIPRLFRGGTLRTNGPTLFLAGDNPGGVEEVSVNPIQGNADNARSGGGGIGNITINVQGTIVSENELMDTILNGIRGLAAMEAKSPSEFLDLNGRP